MVLRLAPLLSLTLSCSGLAGCFFFTTKREGQQLKQEISRLSDRIATMRKNEKALKRALQQARSDQVKLERMLKRARQVLLTNSADLGARVQILESQLAKVLGRLENAENDIKGGEKDKAALKQTIQSLRMELAALTQRVKALHTRPAEPQGADAVFAHAQKLFQAGSYAPARRYFQRFALTHPTDNRVEYALFQVALSYFKENKFGAANHSFKQILRRFPTGKYTAHALLYQARCHFELKYCKSALTILAELRRRYPGSQEAGRALRMFQRVRRLLRNSRFCGS